MKQGSVVACIQSAAIYNKLGVLVNQVCQIDFQYLWLDSNVSSRYNTSQIKIKKADYSIVVRKVFLMFNIGPINVCFIVVVVMNRETSGLLYVQLGALKIEMFLQRRKCQESLAYVCVTVCQNQLDV